MWCWFGCWFIGSGCYVSLRPFNRAGGSSFSLIRRWPLFRALSFPWLRRAGGRSLLRARFRLLGGPAALDDVPIRFRRLLPLASVGRPPCALPFLFPGFRRGSWHPLPGSVCRMVSARWYPRVRRLALRFGRSPPLPCVTLSGPVLVCLLPYPSSFGRHALGRPLFQLCLVGPPAVGCFASMAMPSRFVPPSCIFDRTSSVVRPLWPRPMFSVGLVFLPLWSPFPRAGEPG